MTIPATAPDAKARRPPRHGWRGRAWRLASTAIIVALVGVNAWWLIRDALPATDLKTINRQVATPPAPIPTGTAMPIGDVLSRAPSTPMDAPSVSRQRKGPRSGPDVA